LVAGLPDEVGKLVDLEKLDPDMCVESRVQLIYRRSINDSWWFAAVPDSISNLVNLTYLNLASTRISSE
jgi:hypothetical protein